MKSNKELLGFIEYEIALLIRRTEFYRASDPIIVSMDRSAYLLLRKMETRGPVGVKVLAEEFQLDISTVSRQAAALEAKGLVQRLSNPADGRGILFQITSLGHTQLAEVRQARLEKYAELLEDWSTEDRQKFGELLARFNRILENR